MSKDCAARYKDSFVWDQKSTLFLAFVAVLRRRFHTFPQRQLLGHLPDLLQRVRVILHSEERETGICR